MIINSQRLDIRGHLFISIALFIMMGCSVVSGNFVLDNKSPLPVWFKNQSNIPRENLTVEITIFEAYEYRPGKVSFKIFDSNGKKLTTATGTWEWHPISLKRIKEGNAGVPSWTIIKVNGTTEVYEQGPRNNLLRIVGDPSGI